MMFGSQKTKNSGSYNPTCNEPLFSCTHSCINCIFCIWLFLKIEETIANVTSCSEINSRVGEEIPVDCSIDVRLYALGCLDEELLVASLSFDTTPVTSDEGFVSLQFFEIYT